MCAIDEARYVTNGWAASQARREQNKADLRERSSPLRRSVFERG